MTASGCMRQRSRSSRASISWGRPSPAAGSIRAARCASRPAFALGRKHIAPALSLLAQHYPALDITLDVVDRRVDLISENIDLDVRVGEVDEPHLVAYRVAPSTRTLCAAPGYLERRGVPASIES